MFKKKITRRIAIIWSTLALCLLVFVPISQAYAQAPPANPGSDHVSCSVSGDPLTWLLCPVFNGVSDFTRHIISDVIVPLLKVPAVNLSAGANNTPNPTFTAWSNFRVYGDIFLVIAMLAVVFGQAIGGGIIDAYTAKRVLPRVLVAAILINLSIYIAAALIDFGNILGNGITNLIITPFNGTLNFSPSAAQGISVLGLGILGAILSTGVLAGLIVAMFTSFGTVFMAALFAILPFVFAVIAIFAVLVFRQGLLLLLTLVSPVAFALYVLPNTERIFRKWWDLFLEAVMVYPIVMLVFATAGVMSGIIMHANGADNIPGNAQKWFAANPIAALIAFALQVAPLFLIPFAFRIAGGTLSKAHELVTRGSVAAGKFAQQRGEFSRNQFNKKFKESQLKNYSHFQNASTAGSLNSRGQRRGRTSLWLNKQMMQRAAGADPERMQSELNATAMKRMQEMTSNGNDYNYRGLMVDRTKIAEETKRLQARGITDEVGIEEGLIAAGLASRDEKTKVLSYNTIGGGKVTKAQHEEALRTNGGSASEFQAALSYEMGKATTPEQAASLAAGAYTTAEGLGLTLGEQNGAWIGAAFSQQGKNLVYKQMRADPTTRSYRLNDDGLTTITEQATKDIGTLTRQEEHVAQADAEIVQHALSEMKAYEQTHGKLSAPASPIMTGDPAAVAADTARYKAETEQYKHEIAKRRQELARPLEILRNAKSITDTLRPASTIGVNPSPGEGGELSPGTGGSMLSYASPKVKDAWENMIKLTDEADQEVTQMGLEIRKSKYDHPLELANQSKNSILK